jgi:hypothetical protein
MCGKSIASTAGYDQFVAKQPSVVFERRHYEIKDILDIEEEKDEDRRTRSKEV